MKFYNHYKTIVISDVALGASPENFKKLITFIKNTSCDRLIFFGDIIKGWQLQNVNTLHKSHNKFIKTLFKIAERDNTQIIFVTGTEWDYQDTIPTFTFSNILFVDEFYFKSAGNHYYVYPGNYASLLKKASSGLLPLNQLKLNILLWANSRYNEMRINSGKAYQSVFRKINFNINKENSLDQLVEQNQEDLNEFAIQKNCQGIICAHPLYSGIYHSGSFNYLSAGNWTESLTALAESNYGKWEVIHFEKVLEEKTEALKYKDMVEELFKEENNAEQATGS